MYKYMHTYTHLYGYILYGCKVLLWQKTCQIFQKHVTMTTHWQNQTHKMKLPVSQPYLSPSNKKFKKKRKKKRWEIWTSIYSNGGPNWNLNEECSLKNQVTWVLPWPILPLSEIAERWQIKATLGCTLSQGVAAAGTATCFTCQIFTPDALSDITLEGFVSLNGRLFPTSWDWRVNGYKLMEASCLPVCPASSRLTRTFPSRVFRL